MASEVEAAVAERPTGLPEQAADLPSDVQSTAAPSGSTLDTLVDPKKYEAATSAALEERKEYGRASGFVDRQMTDRMERDRAQMDQAFKAEGAAANALPPKWNADEEREKYIRGPMESFGSIGSVFAMAASMFTKTPMTSALNAGAAAMKAVHDNDEKAYESAYKAWKDNTELALKRFGMEHQIFADSQHLMTTDMQAWAIKQKALAARFENNNAMILLENGMYKEYIDTMQAQQRGAIELEKAKEGFEEFNRQRELYRDGTKAWEAEHPDATESQKVQHRLQLLHDIKSGQRGALTSSTKRSPEQVFTEQFYAKYPNATPEEFSAAFGEFKQGQKAQSPDTQFIQQWYDEHPDGTSEEFGKAFGEFKRNQKANAGQPGGGNTQLTIDRQNAKAVADQKEVWRKEGLSEDEIAKRGAEMYAKLKSQATPITATNRDQIDSMLTRIDTASQQIDKVEALLKKHNAMTGLGGKIARPGEVVSNWFGNNETDRAQFRRYIEELRELGPRLLQESKSRPLSSEEKRIQAIVPGLDAGDTTQNTARGLKELQDLFKQLRAALEARRGGTFQPDKPFGGTQPDTKSKPPDSKPPWESAPIKVPAQRSEIEADVDAA